MNTLKVNDKVTVDITGIACQAWNGPLTTVEAGTRSLPSFSPPIISGINTGRVIDISINPEKITVRISRDGYYLYYTVPANKFIGVE